MGEYYIRTNDILGVGYMTPKEKITVPLKDNKGNHFHDYPLLPGDGLIKESEGTYKKVFDGIMICGMEIDEAGLISWDEWYKENHND